MVNVTIHRNPDRTIRGFTMDGHANFAEHGEDIVCAGVSAVAYGTVNSIEALLKVKLRVKLPEPGHMDARVPDIAEPQTSRDVQLLLESMIEMIKGIASSYKQHVALRDSITQ